MLDNFPFKIKIEALDSFSPKLAEITKNINQTSKALSRLGSDLTQKISLPLGAIVAYSVKSFSDFENLTIQFQTILGSADKATAVIKDLMKFSASTPFETVEVANVAKKYIAGNVALGEELNNLLRLTGDIAAGSGQAIEEISNPISKVLQKGKASLEEIYPLAERGIPIIKELQNVTGFSRGDLFKQISAGAVSAEVFLKALDRLNDKGNMFAGATENLSQSLSGLGSTLKDSLNFAGIELGTEIVNVLNLKEAVKLLTDAISNLTDIFKNLPAPLKAGLASLILVGVVIGPIIYILGQLGLAIGGLIFTWNAFQALMLANPAIMAAVQAALGGIRIALATLMGPWGIAIALIVAAAALVIANWDTVSAFFKDFFGGLAAEIDKAAKNLGKLFNILPPKTEFTVNSVSRPSFSEARSNMTNSSSINRSIVDVNFGNTPRGTNFKSAGNSNLNLNVGYSVLSP